MGHRPRTLPDHPPASLEKALKGVKRNATPLELMLCLMRDPETPAPVRVQMAVAAAPFVHGRAAPIAPINTRKFTLKPAATIADAREALAEIGSHVADGTLDLDTGARLVDIVKSQVQSLEAAQHEANIAAAAELLEEQAKEFDNERKA